MTLTLIPQRQLDLGPAGWFHPEAMSPAANQVRVKAGFIFAGGQEIIDRFTGGDQLSAGFAVVGAGFQRYDLLYLNSTGALGVLQGTAVASGSPPFQGAPGWLGTSPGPDLLDETVPIAWILITETATVIVTDADITSVQGFLRVVRDLDGYFVDKASTGVPTGTNTVVTGLFAGEFPTGNASAPFAKGVIVTVPLNLIHLLDQKGDEIIHAATGARIFGRLTYAAGVWTLTYKYLDGAGVEQTVAAIQTDTTLAGGLTAVHLAAVPKIYSRNDPNRPMFASPLATVSDQVAADIPNATTSLAGKVLLAAAGGKAGAVNTVQNNGAPLGGGNIHTINVTPAGVASSSGAGLVTLNIAAAILGAAKFIEQKFSNTLVSTNGSLTATFGSSIIIPANVYTQGFLVVAAVHLAANTRTNGSANAVDAKLDVNITDDTAAFTRQLATYGFADFEFRIARTGSEDMSGEADLFRAFVVHPGLAGLLAYNPAHQYSVDFGFLSAANGNTNARAENRLLMVFGLQ